MAGLPGSSSRFEDIRRSALARALRVRLRPLAVGVAVVVVVLGVFGALTIKNEHFLIGFNLDGEVNFPATFSSGLLVADAALAFLLAGELGMDRSMTLLAAFFAFMAVDEFVSIHERIDQTGMDWQLVYLPVVVAGGLAWLGSLRVLGASSVPGILLVAGAGAWIAAQAFELVEVNAANMIVHHWMIVPEELLEMTGSGLFGFGLLSAIRARHATGRTLV